MSGINVANVVVSGSANHGKKWWLWIWLEMAKCPSFHYSYTKNVHVELYEQKNTSSLCRTVNCCEVLLKQTKHKRWHELIICFQLPLITPHLVLWECFMMAATCVLFPSPTMMIKVRKVAAHPTSLKETVTNIHTPEWSGGQCVLECHVVGCAGRDWRVPAPHSHCTHMPHWGLQHFINVHST